MHSVYELDVYKLNAMHSVITTVPCIEGLFVFSIAPLLISIH